MAKLQDTLDKMFGQLNIAQTQLPEYFETGLNPSNVCVHIRRNV